MTIMKSPGEGIYFEAISGAVSETCITDDRAYWSFYGSLWRSSGFLKTFHSFVTFLEIVFIRRAELNELCSYKLSKQN